MKFIIREGFKKLKNYKKLTFATFLTSTISYLLLSIFLIITFSIVNSFNVFRESETKIIAFVNSKATEEKIEDFKKELELFNGVTDTEFISSEDGLNSLQSDFEEEQLIENFEEDNPIPHTFIISFSDKKNADIAYSIIKENELIDNISYEEGYLLEINETLKSLKIFLTAIVAGLLLSSVFFIIIVISLSIHNQKDNIKIMLLTGSPISYISAPFVVQGLFISISSSILSSFLTLYLCNEYLSAFKVIFPFLNTIDNIESSVKIIPIILIILGFILGGIGSAIASKIEIKKVMKNL